MKKLHTFKLIDGRFSTTEASRVLLDLVGTKIQYHEIENFSSRERFGKDAAHSARRLKALNKLKSDLKNVLEMAADQQYKLKIKSSIEIVFIEKKTFKK